MGFSQSPTVTEPGDYAVRGGLIDVWPPGHPSPVRLDFFGDTLDGCGASMRHAADDRELDAVEFAPVSEVILDEAAVTRFRQNYRIEFGAAGTDDPLYEAVSAGASTLAWSTGSRSSTSGWRRCSTTCQRRR
jgi:transcription-repair coupling factor (superfamily II helicase)